MDNHRQPTLQDLGAFLVNSSRTRWLSPEEIYLLLVLPPAELGISPLKFPPPIIKGTFIAFISIDRRTIYKLFDISDGTLCVYEDGALCKQDNISWARFVWPVRRRYSSFLIDYCHATQEKGTSKAARNIFNAKNSRSRAHQGCLHPRARQRSKYSRPSVIRRFLTDSVLFHRIFDEEYTNWINPTKWWLLYITASALMTRKLRRHICTRLFISSFIDIYRRHIKRQ